MTKEKIDSIINESVKIVSEIKNYSDTINEIINVILESLKNEGKVIAFGNGGSAADAQHFVAEFVGRFKINRASLPAISFTTDSSILTAISNDYSFDDVFSRQCESLLSKNDVIVGISTSGNSKNVINGLNVAKKMGIKTIGLLGNDGGKIKDCTDISIIINSNDTARIQEAHRVILHVICDIVEQKLFFKY